MFFVSIHQILDKSKWRTFPCHYKLVAVMRVLSDSVILCPFSTSQLQMKINISLSGDFVSELHRHTMIPSTPNASWGWWHTPLLPALQNLWMKNNVAETEVTPHEPPRLYSWNFDRTNEHRVETQSSWNPRLLSGQRWFSPVFSFRRRDCNQKGGRVGDKRG